MSWRYALKSYITNPETVDDGAVIFFNDEVTIIRDSFPKSECHLLVLPRSKQLSRGHPTSTIDSKFKNNFGPYVDSAINYVFKHFQDKFQVKKSDQDMKTEWDESVLKNKDIFVNKFLQIGIHSVPSMANLHIHVISRDYHSVRLKNKKHYNSFNTEFFIDWDDLPLNKNTLGKDKDIETKYLKNHDLVCCYCHENFGNKFSSLKKHLELEFNNHFEFK
ncbi:hnt3p [Saccharomyces arboricola H-6]|uniref:Aprataxin-like protein n=1 Tax=Saccharomyces arboricola (strain H-6 / AS 2.3317 / CBS 10644) TaxID=1160507 RepID=J8Q1U9_SACAR|nr:hnt3p [Saccharomyces arboricola H-6]